MVLQVGMIGAGKSAVQQARNLSRYSDVQVTVVAEPVRPARDSFARAFQTRLAVSDHRRLASDPEVDIVYICSPPTTHSEIAIDCLNDGKHVICLPPMATTVNQAEDMISAAAQNGKRLFIAIPHRYDPACQMASQMIERDEIGYPFMALASFIENDYNRLNDWHDWKGTWDMGGGGILMERGSEMIDLLRLMFGEVDATSAVCTRFAIEALNKAEDTCLMDLEFLAELTAQIALTGAAQFSAWPDGYTGSALRLMVYGVGGSIQISSTEPHLVLSTRQNRHQVLHARDMNTGRPTDMNRDFLDCILKDREPLATAEHARDALKVVVAAYKSSQMKRRVETLEEL